MTSNPIDFNNIQRPKLLMSAAKQYVIRKKQMGLKTRNFTQNEIEKIARNENALEQLRVERDARYSPDAHIKALAEMIEYLSSKRREPVLV